MAGKLANFKIKGDEYETAVQHVLGKILSLTPVPAPRDYGIDFYCSVRLPSGDSAQTTLDLFALQAGGPGKRLRYGGVRKNKPREYEIAWLKSLTVPFYYARVDNDCERIDLYSLSPIWHVLILSPGAFEINCIFENPTEELFTFQFPTPKPSKNKKAFGDKNVWEINLGPPFLSITAKDPRNPERRREFVELLRSWLRPDWNTINRFQLRVALTDYAMSWSTNSSATLRGQRMYWSTEPGANLRELTEALRPALINLGANLQWQDNPAALSLISLLEWIQDMKLLDAFGRGLLQELKKARDLGVSPGDVIKAKIESWRKTKK